MNITTEFNEERNKQKTLLRNSIKRLCVRLFILFLFSAFGGFLFRWAEGLRELEYKCGVKKVRRDFLDALWQGSQFMKEEDWKSLGRRRLLKFEDELHTAFDAGINTYSGQKSWSFLNSVFYSMTVITTIGYGHITPVTFLGKLLTILYALFGIPLFTIILGDTGRVFTRILKLYMTRKDDQISKSISVDEEFNSIPLKTAILFLIAYSSIGTIFFYFWESEWGLLGSFYFVFISTSTIGFGDLVPENPLVAILSSIYFLFGLALTAAVIGLIQERIDGPLNTLSLKVGNVVGVSEPDSQSHVEVKPFSSENDVVDVDDNTGHQKVD